MDFDGLIENVVTTLQSLILGAFRTGYLFVINPARLIGIGQRPGAAVSLNSLIGVGAADATRGSDAAAATLAAPARNERRLIAG